jgi:hypothetical protein
MRHERLTKAERARELDAAIERRSRGKNLSASTIEAVGTMTKLERRQEQQIRLAIQRCTILDWQRANAETVTKKHLRAAAAWLAAAGDPVSVGALRKCWQRHSETWRQIGTFSSRPL